MIQEYNYVTRIFPPAPQHSYIEPIIYWFEGVLKGYTQQDLEYAKYLSNSGGISGITLLN
jgi:hypothetical protein